MKRSALVGLVFSIAILTAACSGGYQAESPTSTAPTIDMSSSPVPSIDKTPPPGTTSVLPTAPDSPYLSDVITADPFEQVQTNLKQLVTADAQWRAPDALKVDEPDSIGLQIGDSPALREAIGRKLPGTQSSAGGPVTVGPTVSVRLVGDPGQVEITPKEAIVQSTTRDVAMLFTWIVKSKIVTDDLHLQAIVEVPLQTASQVASVEIPLNIKVKRTVAYTFGQIFSHWATWAAIAAALLAFFRRIRNLVGRPFGKLTRVAASKEQDIQEKQSHDKGIAETPKP